MEDKQVTGGSSQEAVRRGATPEDTTGAPAAPGYGQPDTEARKTMRDGGPASKIEHQGEADKGRDPEYYAQQHDPEQ